MRIALVLSILMLSSGCYCTLKRLCEESGPKYPILTELDASQASDAAKYCQFKIKALSPPGCNGFRAGEIICVKCKVDECPDVAGKVGIAGANCLLFLEPHAVDCQDCPDGYRKFQ